MSRPSSVSWAMMSAREDIYSILGMAAGRVNGVWSLRRWFVLWSIPLPPKADVPHPNPLPPGEREFWTPPYIDGQDVVVEDYWIPAFAGMTSWGERPLPSVLGRYWRILARG